MLAVPLLPELWAAVSAPELGGFQAFLADDGAAALITILLSPFAVLLWFVVRTAVKPADRPEYEGAVAG